MRTVDTIRRDVKVVALGGGTGLPVVLRGFKTLLFGEDHENVDRLAAIVTVTDDGGSSGRLQKELGVVSPGDLRNCLVALSHNRPLVARLFQTRYRSGETLEGHSCGNLILAALAQEENGSFLDAINVVSEVLNVRGRVLPLTLEPSRLVATMASGEKIVGECAITRATGTIARLCLDPSDPPPTPGVVEAILSADIIVMGPGSLFTSIMPNLLVPEVADAMRRSTAFRVAVLNAMTEDGETQALGLSDHVRAIQAHTSGEILDAVLVATDPIRDDVLERYRAERAARIDPNDPALDGLVPLVVRTNLLQSGPKVRHDALLTARAVLRAYAGWKASRTVPDKTVVRFPRPLAGGEAR